MSGIETKSFFQKPEGKTGMFFLIAALVAGGWGLYVILPTLIILMQNLIYAGCLAGFIALVVFLIADKRFRTLVSYMYKSAMRALTGLVIEIDPIGILKGYVEDLNKKLGDMRKSMADLAGQIRKLEIIIRENEEKRQHALQIAKQAHDRADMKPAFILQSRQAGRLGKSNLTLQALLNKMNGMSKVLKKMYEVSQFTVQDIESEVEVKTQERNAINASHGAFRSAMRIIQGGTDQKAIFDQTLEHMANDYAMKVGEIEQFMEMSEGFIKSVDLENGVYEQEALDQFDQWSQKADQLLLRVDEHPVDAKMSRVSTYNSAEAEAEAEAEQSGSFSNLFDQHK